MRLTCALLGLLLLASEREGACSLSLPQLVSVGHLGTARALLTAQLHDHGFVRLLPTAGLARDVVAVEAAAGKLFALDAATKGHIDAAMRTHGRCDHRELQLWCTGLRVNPAACSSAYKPDVQQHEQFHVVFDPTAIAAMAWPRETPALRRAVVRAGESLQAVSESLLSAVAPELLMLRAQQVAARGNPSVLDLFQYHNCTGDCLEQQEGGRRMDSHVDPGIFTCKYIGADQVSGLEVQDRQSGKWVGERALGSTEAGGVGLEPIVLCFVNEALAEFTLARPAALSGNYSSSSGSGSGSFYLTATPHRVVLAPADPPRLSVVYEMRSPAFELWDSLEEWSRAKREARQAEIRKSRRQQMP